MARKPKMMIDPQVKKDLLDELFGKDGFTLEIADKILKKGWAEAIEKYFEDKKPKEETTPVDVPKNVKYKQAYEKLAKQVEKMNELVIKIKEETKE